MPEITSVNLVVPAVISIVGVILTQLGMMLIQRSKRQVEDTALLSASERDFRRDIMGRLKDCERKHEECRTELGKRDVSISEINMKNIQLTERVTWLERALDRHMKLLGNKPEDG